MFGGAGLNKNCSVWTCTTEHWQRTIKNQTCGGREEATAGTCYGGGGGDGDQMAKLGQSWPEEGREVEEERRGRREEEEEEEERKKGGRREERKEERREKRGRKIEEEKMGEGLRRER